MELQVRGVEKFDLQFDELKATAENGNGESQILFRKLKKAIEKLKYDYRAGEHISKEKIPLIYKTKYGVENLWKLNIDQKYRLIYTIVGEENKATSVLLEFYDHNEYNKWFGYK